MSLEEEIDFGEVAFEEPPSDDSDKDDAQDKDDAEADAETAPQDDEDDDGGNEEDNNDNAGNDNDEDNNRYKSSYDNPNYIPTEIQFRKDVKGTTYGTTWSETPQPVTYICGVTWDKHDRRGISENPNHGPYFEVVLKRGEPLMCKACKGKILFKKRTNRLVQFDAR